MVEVGRGQLLSFAEGSFQRSLLGLLGVDSGIWQ
jgi:hypothetical protein